MSDDDVLREWVCAHCGLPVRLRNPENEASGWKHTRGSPDRDWVTAMRPDHKAAPVRPAS